MTRKEFLSFLREFWYLAPIVLGIAYAIVYFMYQAHENPGRFLADYGYLIILVWTFLEGETIVIIAGILAPIIGLKPWIIALCAFIGSFSTDQLMFAIGKYKGKDFLRYFPRAAQKIDRASTLFKKYDTALILSFRFIYGVRNITPIMLGISGVSHKKFFILNFFGAAVWAATFTYGGYFAGEAFRRAVKYFGYGVLYILLSILAVALGLWYIRARTNVKKAKDVAAKCTEELWQGDELSPECRNHFALRQEITAKPKGKP